MKMLFGKFRGVELGAVPDDYLCWLATLPQLRDPLLTEVNREISRRAFEAQQSDSGEPCPDAELAAELIGVGLRVLAKKFHPDIGGDHARMVRLNECAKWLREKTEEDARVA